MSSNSAHSGSSRPENGQNKGSFANDDLFLDQTLRPSSWDEYIGQRATKDNLKVLLKAAAERKHPPEHILFYGPPGLGKTTLAHLIAKETASQLKSTSGPAIEKVGDLASILTNLAPGDMLFIDEIHRLNKAIEEVLYPAMESGSLDIIIGKGPSARTIQLELPPFTLLAATTRIALLSSPLRSRFSGGTFKLEFYTDKEIQQIIGRSAKLLGIEVDEKSSAKIAQRSRYTPRTANFLLKRVRDLAQVERVPVSEEIVDRALSMLGIDELGLTQADRDLLRTLIDKFNGGPVGLNTLAASLAEEEATVEEVHEPYLLQLGLIERTPRGRKATEKAFGRWFELACGLLGDEVRQGRLSEAWRAIEEDVLGRMFALCGRFEKEAELIRKQKDVETFKVEISQTRLAEGKAERDLDKEKAEARDAHREFEKDTSELHKLEDELHHVVQEQERERRMGGGASQGSTRGAPVKGPSHPAF